jgi:nucleoside-diphosphate-sugar epimerase
MVDSCVHLMNLPDVQFVPLLGQNRNDSLAPLVNIGVGHDLSIRELAETVKDVVGYQGTLELYFFDNERHKLAHVNARNQARKPLSLLQMEQCSAGKFLDLKPGWCRPGLKSTGMRYLPTGNLRSMVNPLSQSTRYASDKEKFESWKL